jgi:hypothetical protein
LASRDGGGGLGSDELLIWEWILDEDMGSFMLACRFLAS